MYEIGASYGHNALLRRVRDILRGYPSFTVPAYIGAGNGRLTNIGTYSATPYETWTLTCTAAGPAATFSVGGSVSGAKAAATVGTAYDNGLIQFLLVGGTVDFQVGDQFTFSIQENGLVTTGQVWTEQRFTDDGTTVELITAGPGLSGTEEIYIGFQSYENVPSDYYNWRVATFTGFLPSDPFKNQPGYSGNRAVLLWNQVIDYWIIANGQRFALAARVGNTDVYTGCYLGKYFFYGTPGQMPYPVVAISAYSSDAAIKYSDTSSSHVMGYKGNSNLLLRRIDGSYVSPECWPWNNGVRPRNTNADAANPNGEYVVLPIIMNRAADGIYGELDGVVFVPDYNMSVESEITIGTDTYKVFQNIFRTGAKQYYALKLA